MSHLGDVAGAFVDDELGPEARARALAHIAGCAACRAEVDQQHRLKSRLRATSDLSPGGLGAEDAVLARLVSIPEGGVDESLPPTDSQPRVVARPGRPTGSALPRPTGASPSTSKSSGPGRQPAASAPAHHPRGRRGRYVAAAGIAASVVVGIGGAVGAGSGGAVGAGSGGGAASVQGRLGASNRSAPATGETASDTGGPLPFGSVRLTGAVTAGYRLP